MLHDKSTEFPCGKSANFLQIYQNRSQIRQNKSRGRETRPSPDKMSWGATLLKSLAWREGLQIRKKVGYSASTE